MIVVKKDEVEPIDVGKLLNIKPLEGVNIQWLIHKGVGDDRYGHRFALRRYTVPPGAMFPMHFHEYTEAFYIVKGRLSFEDEENKIELGPGDLAYSYSDEPHGGTNIGDEEAEILCCIDCLGDGLNCDPEKQAQVVKGK